MKRALVTGSTQGIGKAIAERLVKVGYYVIVHCSKDSEKAERIRKEIKAHLSVVADLDDSEDIDKLKDRTGNIDILVLNASVQYKQDWQNIGESEIRKQLNVNIVSTLKLMQIYYPYMKEQKFGRIITIGSVNQYRNHPDLTFYSATKCAVASLVKNIAKQVAIQGVTINNVVPGAICTPRNQAVYNDDEKRKAVEKTIPVGRFGRPCECAGVVEMLCSDDGGYITGTDIVVDGGMKL